MAEPSEELPPTLRHQMDDWDEQVRDQQIAFTDAAEDLEEQAREIREKLETADETGRRGLLMHLDLVTTLAANVRTMAKIPFPIPDEGVTVREEPSAPGGIEYLDPDEAAEMFPSVQPDPDSEDAQDYDEQDHDQEGLPDRPGLFRWLAEHDDDDDEQEPPG